MPDNTKRIDYYYVSVPETRRGRAHPGRSARCGCQPDRRFGIPAWRAPVPIGLGPGRSATFAKAARAAGLTLSRRKSGFIIQGEDRPGAVADIAKKVAERNINVTSVQLFCTGSGRYGGMLWVKVPDLRKAAKALGIK